MRGQRRGHLVEPPVLPAPDRPVLTEPEERPTPAPFRIRLGDVVRLNGAIPRGIDLRGAIPKRCAPCGALFLVFGKGRARAKYCADCRAKKCPSCNGVGGDHYPYCNWAKPHPCKGCGVERPRGIGNASYCDECRATQCPECNRYAGQHGPHCLHETRQRHAAPLTERLDRVTEAEILALYVTHRALAIRRARRICGVDAEDVIQDTVTYLLAKRAYLRRIDAGYFFRAITNAARRQRLYAWAKYVVAMDPWDLVLAEQAMVAAHRKGRRVETRVRLPEPGDSVVTRHPPPRSPVT